MFRKVNRMNKEKIINILKKCKKRFKKIMESKYLFYLIILVSLIIFIVATVYEKYNVALSAVTMILLYNILFGLANIEKRFMFTIMNLMLFTFVLDRPLISMFRGDEWWYFSSTTIKKALLSIMTTEIFLLIGDRISEKIPKNEKKENYSNSKKILQVILLIAVLVTGIVSAYMEIFKYIDMKDVDYALNYTNEVTEFPIIIRTLATMFSYCVFAYLATMPPKKYSLVILIVYILIGIPAFLLGSRNSLILRVLFAITYMTIRNYFNNENEIWITKKIKVATIIALPIVIIFLGAYNYIRSDEKIQDTNPISLITDFFYKQGTTFDTICQGFEYEENFKNQKNVISYTFGDIIDYIKHNTISQKVFKTEDLGSGNSMTMVEKSNSLAHRLAYIVLGKGSYLSGHGRGTSYIIETYMDAGMVGVALYSCILGIYLSSCTKILEKDKFLVNYIILTSISQIFLLPRYSASGFISFIVTPQFWIVTGAILLAKIIIKVKEKEEKNGK